MLFDQGKLEKLIVRAFLPAASADEAPQVSDSPDDTYTVQVNPSTYTLHKAINYADRQGQGDSGSDAIYTGSEPTALNFNFLFDATGVVPPPSELGDVPLVGAIASLLSDSEEYVVMDEIEKFNRVVYRYDGELHRPRKVLLIWGTLQFACALTSLIYEFKLFKPDGTPLRATANCSFREAFTDSQRELAEANSSADLTHQREVRAGDTLPLLSYRIYGDPRHYLALARRNRLVNFRSLRPGARLSLPRLDDKVVNGRVET